MSIDGRCRRSSESTVLRSGSDSLAKATQPIKKTASELEISDEDASDEDRVLMQGRHAAAASPVGRVGRAEVDR